MVEHAYEIKDSAVRGLLNIMLQERVMRNTYPSEFKSVRDIIVSGCY